MMDSLVNPRSKLRNVFRAVYDNPRFKNVLEKKSPLPQFPFLVDIEVTNRCNLACVFCGQRLMKREKGNMSEDVFKKVIDECDRHATPVRLIRWGEPFLHPDIISFISFVKREKKIPLHITTNGLCFNDTRLKELVDVKLDSLIFSFQGTTEKEYEIMRNNKRYKELKTNILRLVELRGTQPYPFIQITTTITNEPEEEVESFLRYWGSIVDFVSVGQTNLSRIAMLGDKGSDSVKYVDKLSSTETIDKTYMPCREVYQKLSVNYDGSVSACCADFDRYMLVGDVAHATLEEIWNNSAELKMFRDLLDSMKHDTLPLCRACFPTHRRIYKNEELNEVL